jgi:hypothetical protein
VRGAALIFALVACRSSSPGAPAADARVEGPSVRLVVDGEPVGSVAVADLAPRPTLASLLGARAPVGAWREISADAAGGATFVVVRPGDVYADQDAIAYLDGGRAALGMFRRVAADATPTIRALADNPTIAAVGVTEIRVRTREAVRPALPPASIALHAEGQDCVLDAAALAAITPSDAGRGGADRPGWDVRDLARHCFGAAPIAVHAGAAGGLDVDAATLARADRRVIAKVNRRGQLKVRLIEPGPGKARVLAEVGEVTRIEVTLEKR